jgi:hypothetical protein
MRKLILLFASVLISAVMYAQPEPGDDPGGAPGGGVPLDAGLTALLVAGAGYGAKKAYDYRKNSKKDK